MLQIIGFLLPSTHLVKLEDIQKLKKFPVLLVVLKLAVMLLETVKGKLGLIVDIDLHGVLHELLADWTDLFGERRRKHHHLNDGVRIWFKDLSPFIVLSFNFFLQKPLNKLFFLIRSLTCFS